jgi:tetratricopeptide (TPR) repeat protein
MRRTITFALIGFALVSGFGPQLVSAAGPFQKADQKATPGKTAQTKPAGGKSGPTPSADKAEQLFNMARLAERQGQLAEARTMYIALLEKFPEHRDAIHRLGAIAVRSGDTDVALEHLGRAEEIGPPTAELLSDIGYALYLQDRLPIAEQKLRAALSLNPQYVAARNNLGIVLAEQKKFDAALAEFRKAGNEAKAHCNLAYVQTKVGALAEAERNYHKALELDGSCKRAAEALVQFESAREKAKRITAAKGKSGSQQADETEVALASGEEPESTIMDAPQGKPVESLLGQKPQKLPPVVVEDAPRPAFKAVAANNTAAAANNTAAAANNTAAAANNTVTAKKVARPVVKAPEVVEEAPGESLANILRNAARGTPEEASAEPTVIAPPPAKKPAAKTTRPAAALRVDDGIERSAPVPRVDIPSVPSNSDGTISNPYAQPSAAKTPPAATKKAPAGRSNSGSRGPVVISADG